MPKLPFGGGKGKRSGESDSEKEESAGREGEEADGGEGFNWPSRSGRSD